MMSRTQLLVKTVGNRACLFAYTASIELFLSTQKGLFRASSATTPNARARPSPGASAAFWSPLPDEPIAWPLSNAR